MAGNGGPGDKCSFHAPPSPLVSRRPASEGTPLATGQLEGTGEGDLGPGQTGCGHGWMLTQDLCLDGQSDLDCVSQSHAVTETQGGNPRPHVCFFLSPDYSPQPHEDHRQPGSFHIPASTHLEHCDLAGGP